MSTHDGDTANQAKPITFTQYEILYLKIDRLIEDYLRIPEPTVRDRWKLKTSLLELHSTHKII